MTERPERKAIIPFEEIQAEESAETKKKAAPGVAPEEV